jgi:DeoR/GlpR family transcriptional regulator of sugar metabolism
MRISPGYDCWMLLGILREMGASNTHQLAQLAGHSTKVVLQSLRYLAKQGKVRKVKNGRSGTISYPAVWAAKVK